MRSYRILIFLLIFALILVARQRVEAANAAKDEDFLASLTFLGDSTTAHMQQRSPLARDQIWAAEQRYLNLDSRITYAEIVAPDTGKAERIAAVAARLKPRYLVITLGIDYGVYYYRDQPQTFAYYYEKLLDELGAASPDTVCILQSVFPVGRDCRSITNHMIDSANEVIADIAAKRGLCYIDQKPVLADEEGYLRQEYCDSGDGIHLTASAYDAILSRIAEAREEIEK